MSARPRAFDTPPLRSSNDVPSSPDSLLGGSFGFSFGDAHSGDGFDAEFEGENTAFFSDASEGGA